MKWTDLTNYYQEECFPKEVVVKDIAFWWEEHNTSEN